MKKPVSVFIALLIIQISFAQYKTENLVIVTLDGMRWQEVFKGVDSAIIVNKKFTNDSGGITKNFWSDTITERRKKLFPFLWTTVASQGQLYGNRTKDCEVNNANKYWFSYPGYNEIFTGYPDTAVNSNDHLDHQNLHVLESINKHTNYIGQLAPFTT